MVFSRSRRALEEQKRRRGPSLLASTRGLVACARRGLEIAEHDPLVKSRPSLLSVYATRTSHIKGISNNHKIMGFASCEREWSLSSTQQTGTNQSLHLCTDHRVVCSLPALSQTHFFIYTIIIKILVPPASYSRLVTGWVGQRRQRRLGRMSKRRRLMPDRRMSYKMP
jgi:hypothetical protein